MDEHARATLNKLIDPLIPASVSDLPDVLDAIGMDIDERFIEDVLTRENMVPVTDHPLHQKKVLGLAEEFRAVGFPGVAGFLADHVLAAPGLNDALREGAERLARVQAKR